MDVIIKGNNKKIRLSQNKFIASGGKALYMFQMEKFLRYIQIQKL